MKLQRMRDFIDSIIMFHRNLSEFYNELSASVEKERIRILLNHMARHEKNMMKSLKNYEKEASAAILDISVQFDPDAPEKLPCENLRIHKDMTPDAVITMALEFDDCIIRIFEKVLNCSDNNDLKDVFSNLLDLERNSLKKFATDSTRIHEL